MDYFKHQLTTANIKINKLKEKLEMSSVADVQLDQHIQGLNRQIEELFKKLKSSNTRLSENTEKMATLQDTISSLERVS